MRLCVKRVVNPRNLLYKTDRHSWKKIYNFIHGKIIFEIAPRIDCFAKSPKPVTPAGHVPDSIR
jgi:hypothetical protein